MAMEEQTSQLKHDLIMRIKSSNNIEFLNALKALLDSSEQELFKWSDKQKKSISIGREEFVNGEALSNEDVLSNAKEWLKKK